MMKEIGRGSAMLRIEFVVLGPKVPGLMGVVCKLVEIDFLSRA